MALVRTYRVTVETTGERPEFLFFGKNTDAWREARNRAPHNEHVKYELVENNLFVIESYCFYRGEHYDHTDNGPAVDCSACDKPHGIKCAIPGCDGNVHTPHFPSSMCRSGKRNHCTCDACF